MADEAFSSIQIVQAFTQEEQEKERFSGAVSNLGSGTGASLTDTTGHTGLVHFASTLTGTNGLSFQDGTDVQFDDNVTLSAGDTDNAFRNNFV